MILVILASGRGSRLKKETANVPKCLVKINGITILEGLEKLYKYFNKVIIVSGYKYKLIKNRYSNSRIKVIINKKFRSTNMVYSLLLTKKYISSDLVVCYSNKTILPLNKNWLNIWKKRMSNKKIYKDAENVITKKFSVIHIGGKISKNNLPKLQFMGILKIKKNDFFKMNKIFKKRKNYKIDLTSFLNIFLKKNNLFFFKTSKFWYEFDTYNDLRVFKNQLKK
jgi:choline kinase